MEETIAPQTAIAVVADPMPTTRKLTDLFRTIAAEDLSGARSLAMQICKDEENRGHRPAARQLRAALNGTRPSSSLAGPGTAALAGNVLLTTLAKLKAETPLADVVLTPAVRRELQVVIREWQQRHKLKQHGVDPRAKLLFHGPPGCGKSLTARAIGYELGLPVYMVRFDAIIGAYLGQTAIHLRQLFQFAEQTPCVLLLDELDALGKKRGNPLDVGELDRIVIALMQELEHSRPAGVVVGTSNLASHLDEALWRRFDLDLHFRAPTASTLNGFVTAISKRRGIHLPASVVRRASRVQSFAGAESLVTAEIRRQILSDQ